MLKKTSAHLTDKLNIKLASPSIGSQKISSYSDQANLFKLSHMVKKFENFLFHRTSWFPQKIEVFLSDLSKYETLK